MKNTSVVLPDDAFLKRDGELNFDEQCFIDETLDQLTLLHGSYTRNDERLVKQMASFQRSYEMADWRLVHDGMHLKKSGAHGFVPSPWFDIRDRCVEKILKIRKDLRLDVGSRNPITSGQQATESMFSMNIKDEDRALVNN